MNSALPSPIDVLGLGAIAVDDLIVVESYPPADVKVFVQRWERHCGGLTGTALVAASRLGFKTAYAGLIGDDEFSRFITERMQKEGVDMSLALCRPEASPIHSFIVVDGTHHTRNIFVDARRTSGADPSWPPEEVLHSTQVLFVDYIGVPGMLRAARICRQKGIPIVADFEKSADAEFGALLDLVDHLILSQDFAAHLTGAADPAGAAQALWGANREAVVITAGSEGCWFIGRHAPGKVWHQPAFEVDAVDTTGCGDVFHGAYAAALVEKLTLDARIRFASATAAIKATGTGGQSSIPTREAVEEFLRNHRPAKTGPLGTLSKG